MNSEPIFVAFEGGEASGKSTQSQRFAKTNDAYLTREPGGTELGEAIRELFQNHPNMPIGPKTEVLMLAAARSQHVSEVIAPKLDAGVMVVSDRFIGSSIVYQGFGRDLDLAEILELNLWATEMLLPDLNILIDVSRETALNRLKQAGRAPDRLEAESEEFHNNVLIGYRALAEADVENWVIVDGEGDVDEVESRVNSAYADWCAKNKDNA